MQPFKKKYINISCRCLAAYQVHLDNHCYLIIPLKPTPDALKEARGDLRGSAWGNLDISYIYILPGNADPESSQGSEALPIEARPLTLNHAPECKISGCSREARREPGCSVHRRGEPWYISWPCRSLKLRPGVKAATASEGPVRSTTLLLLWWNLGGLRSAKP